MECPLCRPAQAQRAQPPPSLLVSLLAPLSVRTPNTFQMPFRNGSNSSCKNEDSIILRQQKPKRFDHPSISHLSPPSSSSSSFITSLFFSFLSFFFSFEFYSRMCIWDICRSPQISRLVWLIWFSAPRNRLAKLPDPEEAGRWPI